ncbi:Non-canonical purine NTP pyrophosphatase [termite gut metagenome]|uniref:dITP/XTP pyrophosphatase n=1 Tax=termite gut metagenome TaxID=433724 RepID=A0A5J4SZQ2_9ZZZZ
MQNSLTLIHNRYMISQLVFATNNLHKLKEVSFMLEGKVELLSLKDINCRVDIPETAATLEGNALLKARYIYENYGLNCFADDTGLEVEVLNDEPGVYSARYAGEENNSQANMLKLLQKLEGKENRKACFRTVVALILYGKEHLFEGVVYGEIIKERRGNFGFGYDPVFMPEGYGKTYAELGNDFKNTVSHRAMAINKLCEFLSSSS